jgi:mono/diheme cytochrome c family protein
MKAVRLLVGAVLVLGLGCRHAHEVVQEVVPATPAEKHGERVFMVHCNQCHPGGEGGLGPEFKVKPLPKVLIRAQIRAGLGAMPAFGPEKIPDQDLDALMEYIGAIKRTR